MKLTDQIYDLSRRVTALENTDLDSKETIVRIFKFYEKITIKQTIRISRHQYPICSESTICSESLII